MADTINVKQVKIATAEISIKVMKIGKGRLTLSVFRQLKGEHFFNAHLRPRGTPLGTINYFWKGCSDYRRDSLGRILFNCELQHRHIVWQRDSEIRRTCIFPKDTVGANNHELYSAVERVAGQIERLLVLDALEDKITPSIAIGQFEFANRRMDIPDGFLRKYVCPESSEWHQSSLQALVNPLGKEVFDIVEARKTFQRKFVTNYDVWDVMRKNRDRGREATQIINDLEQLFIAI